MLQNKIIGLSQKEVFTRLKEFGNNELTLENKTPLWKKFLSQFTNLMVVILIAAAMISIAVGIFEGQAKEMTDAYVIIGIVILNACIGFFQEYKSDKAVEALQNLVAPKAKVFREKREHIIEAKNLVPGDIILLAEGDKIPADSLLLESNELKIEESALTGESLSVHKNEYHEKLDQKKIYNTQEKIYKTFSFIPNEEKIFMGTSVVSGSGIAVVINTGMKTKFGEIAHLTTSTEKDESPLEKELQHIGMFVGKITLVIASILLLTSYFIQGNTFIHALLFAVAVAVAAVPEGLPAVVTIALALGVQKMAKNNAIMRQLSSVETLGSTTVICSDKTGTLTKNEMTVREAYFSNGNTAIFKGAGYIPKGKVIFEKPKDKIVEKFFQILKICNDSKLFQEKKKWQIIGDPTEAALLTAVEKSNIKISGIQKEKSFPFDSVRKRMSVIISEKKKKQVFVKGAPDSILEICTHILTDKGICKITKKDKKNIEKEYNRMSEKALRVLATAYREFEGKISKTLKHENIEEKLIFVGLVGMIDPPRPEVKDAVNLCHKAGIRTIIVTGDYGKTALAIAKTINIADKKTSIITGKNLSELKNKELKKILKESSSIIFARVAPADKMRIVDTFKQLGEVVAVTGDGVNDAPALKRADIGVAMGITGTDVSKEAANMILTDDSFASIVKAIREGRTIYNNLKKFVWYMFSCNVGELITIFVAIILNIPAPLTAPLILTIDLGTDILPALALGIDAEEPNIMNKKPRNPKEKIMNKSFIKHFLGIGIYIGLLVSGIFIYDLFEQGWQWQESLDTSSYIYRHAISMAFVTLAIIQLFNAFNSRSTQFSYFTLKKNYYLWGATLSSLILIVAFVEIPFFQNLLSTTNLGLKDWGIVSISAASIFFIEEIRKFLASQNN